MKQCPQCSAEYGDITNFCTKDGTALINGAASPTRLCPHCANSIAEDAGKCPYCKADLRSSEPPEWPDPADDVSLDEEWEDREKVSLETRFRSRKRRSPAKSKLIFVTVIALCALGLFLFREQLLDAKFMLFEQRGESQAVLDRKMKALQEINLKELQERDEKIKLLEAQLVQVQQQPSSNNSDQLAGLKAKLDKTQRELTTAQQRLNVATRELDESSRQRAALKAKLEESQRELSTTQQRLSIAMREASRAAASRSQATPAVAQTSSEPAPAQPSRRPGEPGTYETVRPTTVHEDPSASSPVIAQLGKGTKLSVVKSVGNWLEVRSRYGKPPGYIRMDDANYVSSAN